MTRYGRDFWRHQPCNVYLNMGGGRAWQDGGERYWDRFWNEYDSELGQHHRERYDRMHPRGHYD
jgi:hypothetical protein